jgi:hypothetical protein
MTLLTEWAAISARVRRLEGLTRLYIEAGAARSSTLLPVMQPLWGNAVGLKKEITAFIERHCNTLTQIAVSVASDYLERKPHYSSDRPTYGGLTESVIAVCSFESEFSHLISDRGETVKRITERAFLHLSRSLVVDEQLRARWIAALESHETQVEKLGGVHLLLHGIWGFKIDAHGERTDLVLSEPIREYDQVERSAEGLVLTEWKAYRSQGDANTLWQNARGQAMLYAGGCLAATELGDTRYLVLVSRARVEEPGNLVQNGITYRHINIALDPGPPSRERRGLQ